MALVVLALWLGTGAATAQDRGIEDTIGQQLEAFKADDFGAAFDFASPMIKNIFRTPENFGAMVRQGYPMVWAPAQVDFIDLQSFGGILVQRVQVIDQAGNAHYLGYQMIQTEGGWKINGVQILPPPQVAA